MTDNEWRDAINEPAPQDELVLCCGQCGAFFIGRRSRCLGRSPQTVNEFYVPNYRGGFRKAMAWMPLPEPYKKGSEDGRA